ncbi:hypothetical protein AAIA71_28650 (plasmid) [Vibrio harveyi]|uniref:hypothetical protein n=1 Tax=Vibrio harveyi TaxID=669 RepID=UPI0031B9ECDE
MAAKHLPKCPVCGELPIRYSEQALVSLDFDLSNGRFNQTVFDESLDVHQSGFSHPKEEDVSIQWELSDPEPTGKIVAECDCGHAWTLRKFTRIEELIDLHGYNKSIK